MESKVALNQRVKQVVDIKFKNLKYAVNVPKEKKKKYVLKGLNGTFKSGELTAIMGPSGAGKSSLMNILTGFVKNGVDGTINFGNKVQHARKSCAYIMQDDFFYTWFTVEETMMLAATLKISNKSMNLKEKKLLIEQLLETLKLSETKETRCGRLSGGQRKRLSIALELIDNPAVLFLDEPTTGLDSSSSFDTICLLELLAAEGRTIVCTIHQPSSNIYYLFNQIYVMSNGYCTYQGTPRNTVQFLQSVGLECPAYHNPADFIIECVSGDFGDYTKVLAEQAKDKRWRYDLPEDLENMNEFQLAKYNEMKRPSTFSSHRPSLISSLGCDGNKHVYPPPEWMRLWLIIGRCHMQFFRDWTVTYLKLFVHIVTAILLGFLFGDSGQNASKQVSNIGSFLVHLIYLWYTTMMPAILRFPDEIFIIKKETFNNWYKLRTYYMAALITSTPVHIIFSSVYVSILYVMTEQPIEIERYVKFLLAVVFVTICADGMGVFLGTVLNPVNGTFIGAITTCFLMMYSGYLIFLSHMSKIMYYVAYLSPIRYGFESMLLSVYSSHRESLECPETERFCYMKNPVTVLRIFGLEQGNYNFNIAMIFLQIVLFKVLAYFTLKQKLKSSI